jgi:hypothetical protein
MAKSPKNVTVYGRLSFPNFTYQEALARNAGSQFARPDAEVKPDFNVLLEQPQLDKLTSHLVNEFLPFTVEREKAGEKRDALTQAQVDKILKTIESGDWDSQPPYLAIKPVPEKTMELAPEAVASLKVQGNAGQDIVQKAIVNDESELSVPDPDLVSFPVIRPIAQTVHSLYPGCYVAVTLNLYSFVSGKLPGFSAGVDTVVFKADGDRFGGGVSIDEDEMFMD